jgi:hypothetical protein
MPGDQQFVTKRTKRTATVLWSEFVHWIETLDNEMKRRLGLKDKPREVENGRRNLDERS